MNKPSAQRKQPAKAERAVTKASKVPSRSSISPDKSKQIITTTDICRVMNVTRMTVYTWRHLKNNPLPYFHLDIGDDGYKPVRFYFEDLRQFALRRGRVLTLDMFK